MATISVDHGAHPIYPEARASVTNAHICLDTNVAIVRWGNGTITIDTFSDEVELNIFLQVRVDNNDYAYPMFVMRNGERIFL